MLHEVLLALSGHVGGFFKDTEDGIKVLSDLPFVHPSEVEVLNKLGKLGTFYRNFQLFIKQHGETLSLTSSEKSEERGLHGLYLKSFCHGLDAVLQEYRQSLNELEKQTLSDANISLSHFYMHLQHYQLLFSALHSVVEQVKTYKAHGCFILDIVHKGSMSGIPIVHKAFQMILHKCHGIFFKQLCSWLLYGSLFDPYKEFFIQKSLDAPSDSEQITEEDDDLGIMGITGRQLQKILMQNVPVTTSSNQFTVHAELLPAYISSRIANKILFIGESLQMFENQNNKPSSHKKDSIMKNKEDEFANEIFEMSKQIEFNAMGLETFIDKIRSYVAEHLWILVVEESNLIGHLKIIKDFYLLGRGELYLAFIDQAQSLMRQPPTGTTEHDVNMAFQQAARNVLIQDEGLLQRFHLTITNTKQEPRVSSASGAVLDKSAPTIEPGWSYLGLSYTVQWPLHIFFTSGVLEKYNKVFRFLLAVRRSALELQHCWAIQIKSKHMLKNDTEAMKWQLHYHMAFLVDNLQYYLQVDVIESLCGILLDKINSTRDFEATKLAHDHFLTHLLSQSFVHMKPVYHCLVEILSQCNAFCKFVKNTGTIPLDKETQQLNTIIQSFQRQSNLLFNILSSVRTHNSNPHLAQLLLRLDFNKYFTSSGGQLGSR